MISVYLDLSRQLPSRFGKDIHEKTLKATTVNLVLVFGFVFGEVLLDLSGCWWELGVFVASSTMLK